MNVWLSTSARSLYDLIQAQRLLNKPGAISRCPTHLVEHGPGVEAEHSIDLRAWRQQMSSIVGEVRAFASGSKKFVRHLENEGWLPCDGRVLSTLDKKNTKLYAAIQQEWGVDPADTKHSFRVPDLRGLFLRGWVPKDPSGDDVKLLADRDPDVEHRKSPQSAGDPSRVGSYQDDAFRSHTHSLTATYGGRINHAEKAQTYLGLGASDAVQSGASGGKETRPKNAYIFFAIYRGA